MNKYMLYLINDENKKELALETNSLSQIANLYLIYNKAGYNCEVTERDDNDISRLIIKNF